MARAWHGLALVVRFLVSVVTSGVATARVIAQGRGRPRPALVRMGFAPISETGVAILCCLITLTPGTTAIDADMERRELLLHVLDGSAPERIVAQIRQQFERHIVALFGTEAA